jgi:hypothetical protein
MSEAIFRTNDVSGWGYERTELIDEKDSEKISNLSLKDTVTLEKAYYNLDKQKELRKYLAAKFVTEYINNAIAELVVIAPEINQRILTREYNSPYYVLRMNLLEDLWLKNIELRLKRLFDVTEPAIWQHAFYLLEDLDDLPIEIERIRKEINLQLIRNKLITIYDTKSSREGALLTIRQILITQKIKPKSIRVENHWFPRRTLDISITWLL